MCVCVRLHIHSIRAAAKLCRSTESIESGYMLVKPYPRCVALCCCVLRYVAVCRILVKPYLLCVAVRCHVLQCVAVC